MREADRPLEERVSILDRPRAAADSLPPHMLALTRLRVEEASIRLALDVDDRRVYIARGTDDNDLFQFYFEAKGAGASGGPRSILASHGAHAAWNSNGGGCVAHGIVADAVIAVRIGGVEAVLANNAYMAEVPEPGGDVVLTTAAGEREFPRPSILPATAGPTSGPDGRGYAGLVEYAWSGYTNVQIDDLDVPGWHGNLSGPVVLNGSAPDIWRVGVVLLEGPCAGQLAFADLVVERAEFDAVRSVKFVGQTAFGPHPDPPRLEGARRRLQENRARFNASGGDW